MSVINILDKATANLIAAGEVVERPASVIKELLENAIDAHATNITAEIRNGGITYIRVTDNGCGMEREDVPKAFVSHATSKLSSAEDLNKIFTLGFRGEALSSIASVARVELLTRYKDETTGTRFVIEGGKEVSTDDAGCPCGTTMVVRDLFYNTPARMKFLKKDVSEANAVAGVIDRISLSHPQISFRFIRDGKQALVTPGNGNLSQCAYTVLGRDVSATLLPVDYTLDGVRVTGLTSKPSGSRATRSMQFFFLNGRNIKSKTATAAAEEAYKGSVMTGRYPAAVLNIQVDAGTVDVNVHPAKTEVRFSDERKIFSAVYYAVKNAVANGDTALHADVTRLSRSVPVPRQPESVQMKLTSVKTEEPAAFFREAEKPGFTVEAPKPSAFFNAPPKEEKPEEREEAPSPAAGVKKIFIKPVCLDIQVDDEPEPPKPQSQPLPEVIAVQEDETPLPVRYIGEAFKTYIIVEQGEKIIFIDKHASHERMLYEKIKSAVSVQTQLLLEPVAVTLSKTEYDAVIENLALLAEAGYIAEDFGAGTVLVRECPMYIDFAEVAGMIEEIAGMLLSHSSTLRTEKTEWILHNTACRAAIKAGDKSSPEELKVFAERILADETIRYCPHGRPVLFEMSRRDIEKLFGRIQ